MKRLSIVVVLLVAVTVGFVQAGNKPIRARNGMVVSQNAIASQVGIDALEEGIDDISIGEHALHMERLMYHDYKALERESATILPGATAVAEADD